MKMPQIECSDDYNEYVEETYGLRLKHDEV